jgi:hypothetical protein
MWNVAYSSSRCALAARLVRQRPACLTEWSLRAALRVEVQTYYNYNFNLPATAVIKGIQVRLDARADATSGSPKICVQLSSDGGTTWTTARSTTTLSTREATYTLGSNSDAWGRSWTSGNFGNANFRIRVIDVASDTSRDFFLDYAAVNVMYQP